MITHSPIRQRLLPLALIAALLSFATASFAQNGAWTNLAGGSWTNAANWTGGIIATNSGNTANFNGLTNIAAQTVTLDYARTIGNLSFGDWGNSYGWTLNTGSAGPLTLASSVSPVITVSNQTATIGAVLAGTAGLAKTGAGTLVLTGVSTYSGNTYVSNGVITFSGSGGATGGATLTVGPASGNVAVVNLASSGTEDFYTTFNIGAVSGSSGAVNQTAGTVNALNAANYIQIGSGGYGAYVLSGGTLNTTGSGGIRVGYGSLGSYLQTGGFLNDARYFSIGGSGSGGNGVATFTGGGALISASYRFLIPDASGATAVMNVGTEAGGTASITNLSTTGVVMENNSGTGTLNLNSGKLQLAAPILRNTTSGGSATVNFNGGTLQAGAATVTLLAASITSATVYNGGLVIDSQANTATLAGSLLAAAGNGVYPVGGIFTISSGGGSGYLGAPIVAVTTSGSGTGATAIANVSGGVVTGVTMTCPGQNYAAGNTLTFTFSGGGATTAASTFVYTLTANDLSVNAIGGLTKNGSGTLNLTVSNSYSGNTTVNGGTLAVTADSGLGKGNVVIGTNATLTLSGGVTNAYLATTANLVLGTNSTVNLNFTGTNNINGLSTNGGATYLAIGTYGSSSSPAVNQSALFTGAGVLNVSAQPAGAVVTLASSLNPAEYSQSVTFTATASGSSGTPSGTVTFKDGAVTLGIVSLNGLGVATLTTSALAVGSHTILATFNGNATYAPIASSPLTQVINPRNDVWSGAVNNVWNINSTANWLDLGVSAVYHDGDLVRLDDTATGSTAITLGVTVSPYGVVVTNNLDNYSLSGAGAISGTGGLTLLGTGTLTISNANSYTGTTAVQGGTLNFNGSSAYSGSGALNVGNGNGTGVVSIATGGTLTFTGYASLGGLAGDSADTGSGVINQSSGTVNLGSSGTYLELGSGDSGGTSTAYGCYNLSGGALNFVNTSGARVGASGLGVFRQTGGTLNDSRYFAIGSSTGGTGAGVGEATFLGGSATISSAYRIIVGDQPNATAVLNLGTEAGGNATLVALYNSGGNCLQLLNNNGTGTLNLNRGTLQLAGAIYQSASGSANLNLNGGTLQATNNANLITSVPATYVFNGGVVIDSGSFTTTNEANMLAATGDGIYPAGGLFAISSGGGSNYLGAPLVTISGGSGSGAMAIANIAGGVVTSVTMTCPGQNYLVGDSLSFAFSGGGSTNPAPTFDYTLQAGDVTANGAGGVTKVGSGSLNLVGNNTYTGPTLVNAGTLITSPNSSGAGGYVVSNNCTLEVSVPGAGSQLNMSSLNFAGPTSSTLMLDLTAITDGNLSTTAAPLNVTSALNLSGVVTINLSSGGINVNEYPLIQYLSLAGTGSFVLGTVPVGVQAHLVTNTTASPNSIDLVVTSSGQPKWTGAVNGNWDIATTANWVDLLTAQTEVYKEGQPVLFDDTATGSTTVSLTANVHPGSVTFNNSSLPYALTGANKISGATGLTVEGGGSVTITNSVLNDYTGVTVVGGGTLNVNSLASGGQASAIGAATASAANLVFTNNGTLAYSGPAAAINRGFTIGVGGGMLTVNSNLALGGQVAMAATGNFTEAGPAAVIYNGSANNVLGVTNYLAGGTVVFDGIAGGQSNSVTGLMLVGSAGPAIGALVLTNNTVLAASTLTVDYGTASVRSGSTLINNGVLDVGLSSGANATLTVTDNAALKNLGSVYVGGASSEGVLNFGSSGVSSLGTSGQYLCVGGTDGSGDSGAGALNQTAGTVNFVAPSTDYLEIGAGGGGAYGAYNLSGGSAIEPSGGGSGIRVGAGGLGVFTQSGGTLSCGRYFAIGTIGGSQTVGGQGVATFTGGSAAIDSGFRIIVGDKASSIAVLNLGTEAGGAGSVTSLSGTGLEFLGDNAAASATLNLNGGTLQLGGPIYKNTGNTAGVDLVNLNGGTLQAGANNVTLANTTLDLVDVYNGGVVVDSQTNTATITANLKAATGNGVYAAGGMFAVPASSGGGSGYIGAPLVTVTTSGAGSNLTAIATLSGGVVTNVLITCPGQGFQAGDNLSFAFTGGGSANPAGTFNYTLQAGDLTANATGGLTKIGTGKLILSNTNTYSGATVVSNGTLSVNGSILGGGAVTVVGGILGGTGVIMPAVTVNSGATLAAGGTSIGVLAISNTLSFASGATNFARINKTSGVTTNDLVAGLSLVNYAGTLVVTNLGSGTLAAGDKFTLFSAGGYSGNFAVSNLPPLSAGLGWSNSLASNGSIEVVTTINPNSTNITCVVSGGTLTLSWPADHTGWTLEAQTNDLASGLGTNWVRLTASSATNSVSVPADPTQPAVFYRLVYP